MRQLYAHPNAHDCFIEVSNIITIPDKDYMKMKIRLVPKSLRYTIYGESYPKYYKVSFKTFEQWERVDARLDN